MSRLAEKTSSLLALPFSLPWYIYLLLDEAIFVSFKWILPSLCSADSCQHMEEPGWSVMAWLVSGTVLVLAGLLLASRNKSSAHILPRFRSLPKIFSH